MKQALKTMKKETPNIKKVISKKLPSHFDLVTIGVSTGGPEAIKKIVSTLAPTVSAPIVIIQHMPETFTLSLATRLNQLSPLLVKEAKDGEPLHKGCIYIAPGNYHLMVTHKKRRQLYAKITQTERIHSCRPSYDVLLNSIQELSFIKTLNIVLTGMGSDGLEGMRGLRKENYYCITQSASSSVVYGMARVIDEHQLSDETVDLDEIAKKINQYVRQ